VSDDRVAEISKKWTATGGFILKEDMRWLRARIEELEADVRLLRLDNERLRKELEMFPQNDFNPPDAFGMEGPP